MSLIPPHSCTFNFRFRSFKIAPGSAGSKAPLGGLFFPLKVSQIVSMVTHSTPSNLLMFSMWLQSNVSCEILLLCRHSGWSRSLCLLGNNIPLQHHQPVRVAADVRVYGDGVDEASFAFFASFLGFYVFAVKVLKPVHPHLFDVPRVYPAVAVRGFFLYIHVVSTQGNHPISLRNLGV